MHTQAYLLVYLSLDQGIYIYIYIYMMKNKWKSGYIKTRDSKFSS